MTGVHAIVLAAGSGSRYGGRKLLAPWRGGVLLDGALEAALAAPVDSVTVVTGAHDEAVVAAVAGRARVVHAAEYVEGMAGSLRAGIRALPENASGVLILLGDMPLVPHVILAPLVEAVAGGSTAAAPFSGGRRGNPVALSASVFPQLLALAGDQGARRLLDGLGDALVRVETDDPGVLIDVDTADDLPA